MLGPGAVVGSLAAPLFGNRLGRRWTYFVLCIVSIAACQWLFRGFSSFGNPFLAVTFLVGCTTASFYGWLPLYLPELFPTRARATGQGLAFNFGRIMAGFGALYMPVLMKTFDGSYPKAGATISLVYVVGMIAIWFAPETRGKDLPEYMFLSSGESLVMRAERSLPVAWLQRQAIVEALPSRPD